MQNGRAIHPLSARTEPGPSVPDCYFEGSAIVTKIVVVDGEIQTAIGRCAYRQLTADKKRLTHLAI